MSNPFSTPLPHLASPATLSLDVTPAGLKRWTKSLDRHDLGAATRKLYEYLRLTNRAEIPARVRLDWLETLPGIIQTIMEGLRSYYQNKPFPLSDTESEVAQLANALHAEVMLAYRHILASQPKGSLLGRSAERQMRQIACYRLFVHAGEMLCNYRMMYTETPAGMWRHLHAYYERVRRQGWADLPIPGTHPSKTIEMEYRKVLLFALQPLQRMPFGEWMRIKQTIDEWLPLVPLLEANSRPENRPLFCVRFELDTPQAVVTDRCCGACDGRMAGVLLDTMPLVEALQERLAAAESGNASWGDEKQPAAETIKSLLRTWRIPENQRTPRVPVDMPLTMVCGMENIHAMLSSGKGAGSFEKSEHLSSSQASCLADPTRGEKPQIVGFSAIPEESFHEYSDPECEVIEINYSGWESAVHSPWRRHPQEREVEALSARAVNASATGYRLDVSLSEKITLRLGEPIALCGARGDDWELFVLRWARRREGTCAMLGLERMGDGLAAIELAVQSRNTTPGTLHALTVFDERRAPLLLMPPLPFLGKKQLAIRDGGSETAIELADNLLLSPIFEAYRYKPKMTVMQGSMAAAPAKAAARSSFSDPFTHLWGIL